MYCSTKGKAPFDIKIIISYDNAICNCYTYRFQLLLIQFSSPMAGRLEMLRAYTQMLAAHPTKAGCTRCLYTAVYRIRK